MKKYTQADLVSFGKYLLSIERQRSIANSENFEEGELLQERFRIVHGADILNWQYKQDLQNDADDILNRLDEGEDE